MQDKSLEYDYLFKVLLIGDSGVGKSSILVRFAEDDFEEDRPCTIGVDFKTKVLDLDGKKINLTIWDTAGQEKFRSLTSSYYRGTQGIILVYDVTRRSSFASLELWLGEIELYATNRDVVKFLVGNKVDKNNREVSREEAQKFAKSKSMLFMECSAKTNLGVQQAFHDFVSQILDNPSLWNQTPTKSILDNSTVVDSEQQSTCGGYYCNI